LLVLSAALAHAGTIATTFSFQQEDLRKDGELYGSGASYTGVLDGRLTDNTATSALSSTATATVGNQFRSGTNGQNFMRLFSYDLTELSDFITANTSENSVVTVTSVSLKMVASGSTVGTSNGNAALFRTDPFTSSANWSTSDGSTPWTTPYQSGRTETAYNYTGGATALTAAIAGSNPSTGGQTVGNSMVWTSSTNFIAQLVDAVARPDKTLYLMGTRGLGNADGRVDTHTSSAASVDDRPELLVTLEVTTTAPTATWTGASDTSWITAGNWSPTNVPATDAPIIFDSSSTANLNTVLNQDFTVTGVTLTSPTGAVSIGGANTLGLGTGGFDLSAAIQDLTVSTPIVLGGTQSWIVASGRTLGLSGSISGNSPLTIAGEGKVLLGASNILPNGVGNGNMIVTGTLDLNGLSQSVNGLTGGGTIDNSGAGSATLTVGNDDAASTFSGTIQDTGGELAVVKTGTGTLSLSGPNSFSGGFTNNGSGNITPGNDSAFGTGPVVSNAGTIYPITNRTFANPLALNDSILRSGGGNGNIVNWNGAVTATGTSGISADGGTAGINLGSTLDITGATFSSFANGTENTINGDISGAGGTLNVTSGTLNINGTGSYTGTTTLSGSGVFRLQPTGTISNSSNVVITDTGNFNIRNTVGWVYTGTISGTDTGVINLNTGTDAELAGPISGVANINVGTTGTNATISGDISGGAIVTVQSAGATLTLSGNNGYSGITNVEGGSLILGASGSIASSAAVSISAGATLDTSAKATYEILAGQPVTFGIGAAGSSGQITAAGLNITNAEVILSGTPTDPVYVLATYTSLTGIQFASVTVPSGYTLEYAYETNKIALVEIPGTPYENWATGGELFNEDANGDGVINGMAFLLGAATPDADATGLLPTITESGGGLILTFSMRNAANRGAAALSVEHSSDLGIGDSWLGAVVPDAAGISPEVNGVTCDVTLGDPLNSVTATIANTAAASGKLFGRLLGENP
jgi:autotransporter-associated beta strand protein